MAIEFYSRTASYAEFSNFSPHGIEMAGLSYPTVEHYFQAMKFPGTEYAEKIRLAAKPAVAKQLGRSRKVVLRSDWEAVKLDIMRAAVRQKFATHPALRQLLLDTAIEELMEITPGDTFWGAGKSRSGQNWLGRILMEVRNELRKQEGNEQ
ncbi:NADAR family protein [Anatilimnocola sp. NA78]|uniref:NADAR family protein n=1 Tax=Anatilimnocola sp. NA78 TaxID=3415683 RepID=UPI003CE4FB9F